MVSVIIPVYNIEQVLEACVSSVLKQTYTKLEILLVDDGSKDSSSVICDRFAAADTRVKALHKKNGGLSDARNYGLQHATGDYVFYLDGDDWLDDHAIEILRKKADEYNADFVQCDFYYAYSQSLLKRKDGVKEHVFSKEEAYRSLLLDGVIKNFAWGNLIKRDLAQKVPFVKGKFFEDTYWKYQMIDLAQAFLFIPESLVYYRQRENSISADFSAKKIDLLEGERLRLEFFKDRYFTLFPLALRLHWMKAFDFMKLAGKCSPQLADLYTSYFKTINRCYKKYFGTIAKSHLQFMSIYTIYNYCPCLYPMYAWAERIRKHFTEPTHVRINC